MKLIVGICGATGAIYGIRVMEVLRQLDIETHLIITETGKKTIELETRYTIKAVESLAAEVHDNDNLAHISQVPKLVFR